MNLNALNDQVTRSSSADRCKGKNSYKLWAYENGSCCPSMWNTSHCVDHLSYLGKKIHVVFVLSSFTFEKEPAFCMQNDL